MIDKGAGLFQTGEVEKKKLIGIFDAIGWSWNFLFAEKRWVWLLKAQLMYFAAVVVIALPAVVAAGMVGFMTGRENMSWWAIVVLMALALLVMVVVGGFSAAYYTGMFIEIYNDRKIQVFELVKKAWRKSLRFFGLSVVVGLLTLGGFILLVVPGVIWSIMFAFSVNVMYENEDGVGQAMKVSKTMTSGYKWELFKKWVGLALIMGLASAFVGGVTQNNDSLLLSGVVMIASWVINTVGSLIFVKYYYELKK